MPRPELHPQQTRRDDVRDKAEEEFGQVVKKSRIRGLDKGCFQMSPYRPITDIWILGRPKSHYYGAFPEGFLWRAKTLLRGRTIHLCSGKLKPYFPIDQAAIAGDFTVDINPALEPDLVADATNTGLQLGLYDSALIDRPYTEEDAKRYNTSLPSLKALLAEASRLVKVQGDIGVLDYKVPRPTKNLRLTAVIGVFCGYDNNIRAFTVFRKISDGETMPRPQRSLSSPPAASTAST
jgi:hypothetical protein